VLTMMVQFPEKRGPIVRFWHGEKFLPAGRCLPRPTVHHTESCLMSWDQPCCDMRVLSFPSVGLGISRSRERELWARELELSVIPRIAHKDRVPGTLTHHVSVDEVVQTDNGLVLLRRGQIGNLSILQNTDVSCDTRVDGRYLTF